MPTSSFDVVIVGAGAAGVGCGVVLRDLGVEQFTILDQQAVGASFLRWPEELRLLTPSFPSNAFGLLDLNAVAINTSPAFSLRCEHPSGVEYARYLQGVAEHYELPVRSGVTVERVTPLDQGGFTLQTSVDMLTSRFVIWAGGEFQYPHLTPFPGAEHCLHTSKVATWRELAGQERIIIGGYESGIDAAIQLSELGKSSRVLDRLGIWDYHSSDPSRVLSPYTQQRLAAAMRQQRIELIGEVSVERVAQHGRSFVVFGADGRSWESPDPPLLATGFRGSLTCIEELFDWDSEEDYALLTEDDESTRTPGLFLVGPQVHHPGIIFCFIYKFRQRFSVVAQAIGIRLGLDLEPLDTYRQAGMLLEDLSCCNDECAC
jgi:putative flavoprotein involved in K+ transport